MSNNNYKEADIRPEIIRQNYWALLEKEVAKFLDEDKNVKAEFSVHIDCPLYIEGFDFKVLGKHNRSFSPPGHLVYFTPTTFVDILNRAGFKDVKVQTPGKLDVENVRNELLRSPNLTLEMDPFLRELLLADGEKFENARENFQNIWLTTVLAAI